MTRRSLRIRSLAAICLAAMASPVVAAGTGYLFVSSEKDNVVTVLDGETYEIFKEIGTAARPRHLQFSPDQTKIYVAAGDGDAIDIIDVGSLELVGRIDAIPDPELFDLSAEGGTMYISLEDDAKLGILDLDEHFANRETQPDLTVTEPTADVLDDDEEDDDEEEGDDGAEADGGDDLFSEIPGLKVIEVGEEPEGVLADPDGETVYVTSEVANIVHVVDLAEGAIAHNVVVGNRPRRFGLTPDGQELWVTNELSGTVSIVDTKTFQILDEIAFLPRGMRQEDVTPVGVTMTDDGETAIVALGRANHVAFVDVAEREVEDYVLVGSRAWNTALNADNSLLFVVNGLSDDISIIDVDDRSVLRSVRVGRVPHTVLIDD